MKPYYGEAGITIYHGDCRQILPQIGTFDLLLTDPPYGIKVSRRESWGSSNKAQVSRHEISGWDDAPPSAEIIELMRAAAVHQIMFGGNYFHLPPSRCWFVWDKINSGEFADCELAWTNLDKAVRQFRYMWNGMLKEQPEERFHPTQKPLALMKWCISHVPTAKTVLDPFCGSGTTLVAAKDMGLSAAGIEAEERYCEIAANRLRQEVLAFA